MQGTDHESASLTPQESWGAIHSTMEDARSSMYLAGTATILLLWGVIVSLGFISQFAAETLASDFATRNPWISAPLWGVLVVAGMLGSAVIGHRAGRKNAQGISLLARGRYGGFPRPGSSRYVERGRRDQHTLRRHRHCVSGVRSVRHNASPGDSRGRRGDRRGVLHSRLPCGRSGIGGLGGGNADGGRVGSGVDTKERRPVTDDAIVFDETIHQSTRLRIMTMLVSVPEADRLTYSFIQETLDLTGGNLTTHLRKLEAVDYVVVMKEPQDSRPRTWVQATTTGRRAFVEYLTNLERALTWSPRA